MKITIFGATGRTGKHLVKKALERGYQVAAYVRTASKMDLDHENLEIIQGEITDVEKVSQAIAGADAVLSGLGAGRGGPPKVMLPAAKSILSGMKQHNVKRLVWATGAGIPAPEDQPAFINKLIGFLLKLTARKVLQDSLEGIALVTSSELEWIIARGPMLTDETSTGEYRVGFVNKEMKRTLSREDFADFMLNQVESDEWVHKMPALSDQ